MSKIVEFRDRIVQALKDLDVFADVDWYDGIFDQQDIEEWSVRSPAAFVSVRRAPTTHHNTGELNADLRCVVAIIAQDGSRPRDADGVVWTMLEKIAVLANLNNFGMPEHAGRATGIKFERLVDPELRREGVAVGIVEWQSGFTFGRNTFIEHDRIFLPNGNQVQPTPPNLQAEANLYDTAGAFKGTDERQAFPEDDA